MTLKNSFEPNSLMPLIEEKDALDTTISRMSDLNYDALKIFTSIRQIAKPVETSTMVQESQKLNPADVANLFQNLTKIQQNMETLFASAIELKQQVSLQILKPIQYMGKKIKGLNDTLAQLHQAHVDMSTYAKAFVDFENMVEGSIKLLDVGPTEVLIFWPLFF